MKKIIYIPIIAILNLCIIIVCINSCNPIKVVGKIASVGRYTSLALSGSNVFISYDSYYQQKII